VTTTVSPARKGETSSGEPFPPTRGLVDEWALLTFGKSSRDLESVVPGTIAVVYRHQTNEVCLVVAHVSSPENEFMIRELSMPLDDRLSGWVSVDRQTIHNSDPAFDLLELAKTWTPPLSSCFATPLLQNDTL